MLIMLEVQEQDPSQIRAGPQKQDNVLLLALVYFLNQTETPALRTVSCRKTKLLSLSSHQKSAEIQSFSSGTSGTFFVKGFVKVMINPNIKRVVLQAQVSEPDFY